MEQKHLKSVLESLLFVSSKPVSAKEFAKILEQPLPEVKAALEELAKERTDGVVILESNGQYQMSTNPQNSTQVKNFLNTELREKLTDATVEVLGIIAYRQPISKAEIEAIRGVNSQYSLRHLLMRGLIEKISNPNDARSVYYQTTTEFLQHMGLSSVKDLPAFEDLVQQIKLPETPALDAAEEIGNNSGPEVKSEITTGETAPENETEGKEDEFEDDDEDEEEDENE
ncbi:MAG: SMC-Scp complex subunit ScpB [Patescibacteria group bacterium]|nr:SMC-Scp complex subunit ScpB [Patescibacteria group bacterium]